MKRLKIERMNMYEKEDVYNMAREYKDAIHRMGFYHYDSFFWDIHIIFIDDAKAHEFQRKLKETESCMHRPYKTSVVPVSEEEAAKIPTKDPLIFAFRGHAL